MDEMIRLRIDRKINMEEFRKFLEFHQVEFDTALEEVLNFSTLEREEVPYVIIPAGRLEELKVMILVYKDLVADEAQRSLNIPIENSVIDYERTRRFQAADMEELASEAALQGEALAEDGAEIFAASGQEEAPGERDLEDSFYGGPKKRPGRAKSQPPRDFNEVLMEDFQQEEEAGKARTGSLLLDLLKILGLLLLAGGLLLAFMLIR